MMPAMNCSGTYPWMPAPTAMPARTHGQTLPTMSTTASAPARSAVRPRRAARRSPSAAAACTWKTHGSTKRSSFSRPMIQPETMAMTRPGAQVERGHLPAQQAEEQHERHLVHHRRRDEEREGHAQRDARRHEADEERHGGAGAERRDRAQERGQDVADRFPAAREDPPGALGREERADDADAEDHQHEQHQHLGGFEDEELDRRGEVGPGSQADERVGHPSGDADQVEVQGKPGGRCDHSARARPTTSGGHPCAGCYYIS